MTLKTSTLTIAFLLASISLLGQQKFRKKEQLCGYWNNGSP